MLNNSATEYFYVGPRPFGTADSQYFFGREREIDEIVSLVVANRLLLIYAASGAGKTSLIKAGVIPALTDKGFEVFPTVRFEVSPHNAHEAKNAYVVSALRAIASTRPNLQPDTPNTLSEVLASNTVDDADDEPILRVLIFDQFEELFTSISPNWQDRHDFLRQIDDALERNRDLRVLFLMREEYIAGLDSYASLLQDYQSRFRIEKLNRGSALRAIEGPLSMTRHRFAPGVAEKIVDNLLCVRVRDMSGEEMVIKREHVEAVQLQVVCQSIFRSLSPDEAVITMEYVKSFGDVDTALSNFYEQTIRAVIERTKVKEGFLREWFEKKLITPSGTRAMLYRTRQDAGGLANEALDKLEESHLIRSEIRGGARWYELSHDRFIKTVLESNKRWFSQFHELEQKRSQLEARAIGWIQSGRDTGLLSSDELSEVRAVTIQLDDLGIGHSQAAAALIAASQSASEYHQNYQRALIYILAGLAVIAAVIAAIGWLR